MEYLTLQEVKQKLSIPARVVEKLPIHQCEKGYAKEVIQEFIRRHRIPSPQHLDIIAVGTCPHAWIEAKSWEQALWWADRDTLAIVGASPPARIFEAIHSNHPRPLIGGSGEHVDVRVHGWEHAYDLLEDLCTTKTTSPRE